MKTRMINLIGILVLFGLALQGCGSAPVMATAIPPLPTDTQMAPVVAAATSTSVPPPTETVPPTAIPAPTQIKHLTRPGDPVYIPEQTNLDCTIGRTYVSNAPVVIPPACDNAVVNFIERPVDAGSKDYLPYLDIGQTHFGRTAAWIYASIDIYDAVAPKGTGDLYYFFKLDLNFDGRNGNEIIFSVKDLPLTAASWTVNGLQAWNYLDGTLSTVFDQGVGADPDMLWVRRTAKSIEFAFKPSLVNEQSIDQPARFTWWAWAFQGALSPTDLALSPVPNDLYQIDNTCSWGFNVSAANMINHCVRK